MRKHLAIIAAMGLFAAYGSAIAGDADACLDCHDAEEFAGLPTEGLIEAIQATRENPKHKATKDMSDDEIKKVVAALEEMSGG